MDPIEHIKARLSIEDLVASYVQLKKVGSSYKGLCPFHQEKTPSFIVSPNKGLAYCFGCRKGGDVFAFIQAVENIDFPEALKMLAEKAGVTLEKNTVKSHTKEEKQHLEGILEAAQRFFVNELKKHPEALKYLSARGYPMEKITKCGLGFAPDSFHALTSHLQSLGHAVKNLLTSGVATQKEIGSELIYDRFRNRVTFPIHNAQGTLVGFGGRTLSGAPDMAKYLNSPETPLYHKRTTLYQLYQAKESIRQNNSAIIVEGYFDALTSHLFGFTNTVASLGTALTEEQLKLIHRITANIFFAFDADQSGQSATARSIEIAQRMGFNIRVIRVPSGKDPDDSIRENSAQWTEAIKKAITIMEYHLLRALSVHSKATIEGKKQITRELLPVIMSFPNAVEREHYLQQLSTELQIGTAALIEEARKLKTPSPHGVDPPDESPAVPHRYGRLDYLLGILINTPKLVTKAEELLDEELFPEGEEKRLYTQLKASYTDSGGSALSRIENEQDKEHLQILALYTEEKYAAFTKEELEREAENLCHALNKDHKIRRLKTFRFHMTELEGREETSASEKEYKRLLQSYSELLQRNERQEEA